MDKSYLIKAKEFKYPNARERKIANKEFPTLEKFGFEYKNHFNLLFTDNLRAKEVHRQHNLYWWDECLGNRIGFLHETYIYLITQQIRGLNKASNTDEQQINLNTILFEYHLEVFYYFFFSTRDILIQIINLYYGIQEDEKIHRLKEFIKKVPRKHSRESLIKFNNTEAVVKANELRNSFTHRYNPVGTDYRLTLKVENGKEILTSGIKREGFKSYLENVKDILLCLSALLNELKIEILPIKLF